ncbi:filamentous hemagglutinin N-terminal domain-containing protein, partial [Crocosphaera sp. Alani8]|uniref:filamentous hemagglutinin N-terminal domain-containing protein n=1 Tax=Crocosphaera sp. Alani8 TaxID=3038952 RepID=UPI00313DE165
MDKIKLKQLNLLIVFILLTLYNPKILAQIQSDNTLPQDSTIFSPDGQLFIIDGGTERGSNLFHSFSNFNINKGQTAFFNNATNISNIFSRVTGVTPSSINGLITSNGNVNFFLMNPNGITFGPNAQIALGSFFATTAESISFADGQIFLARSDSNPLLTFARPIGVGLKNPGKIQIKGAGQPFQYTFFEVPILPIITPENIFNLAGLRTFPGAGITLVGGEIDLSQSSLAAFGSNLTLIGIEEGFYQIESPETSKISRFADINISGSALGISALGNQESIRLWGKNINVTDGSLIFHQNLGTSSTGDISLKASNSININSQFTPTVIRNLTLGTGNSGSLNFIAPSISITDLVAIDTTTFTTGQGGNIQIEAEKLIISESISETIITGLGSFVTSQAEGTGGNIIINVDELKLEKGAGIASSTAGMGDAGHINISANNITISKSNSQFNTPALISSVSFGSGNAGNINIDTQTLELSQGGSVASTAVNRGNAGNITINATESIYLRPLDSNSNFGRFERSDTGTEVNLFNTNSLFDVDISLLSGVINSSVSPVSSELQAIFNIEA